MSNSNIPTVALTRHERIERGQANRKAREELRNAIRFCMKEGGITPADLNDAAKNMTQTAVNKILSDKNIQTIVNEAVGRMVAEAIKAVQKTLPNNDTVAGMVKGQIEKEAARLAQAYIHNNVTVTAHGVDAYKEGGSF